ncbi:HA1F protein, partial [Acrocephalus arundinaceus]|nr:HA1F protein [Acrocephalus arundinaceus]
VLHSLHYLHVAVLEPGPRFPYFMSMGSLDGIPFQHRHSQQSRAEPQTLGMAAGAELGYWDCQSQHNEWHWHRATRELQMLQEWHSLHTLQEVSGCDLLSHRSVCRSDRLSYDGWEFLSLELRFRRFSHSNAKSMDGCHCHPWADLIPIPSMQFQGYHYPILEPPSVHVSRKEELGSLILSCHMYSLYPRAIGISWMKGDEIWDQEMQWGGIVPNSDGTFHTWAKIKALLEEWEQYQCRVENPGILEPRIFSW